MDKRRSILIVDDDPYVLRFLRTLLEQAGYLPFLALDGQSALSLVVDKSPDLILLDIGLPDIDGFEVCQQVREFSSLPIIVLSVRDTESDRVRALRFGADYHLAKPVVAQELLATIETALRRSEKGSKETLESSFNDGRLYIDFARRHVEVNGISVPLTSLEFRLLWELVRHRNKVLTPAQLMAQVWEIEEKRNSGMLRTCIWRLRKAIEEDLHRPRYIVGMWGVGYMFCGDHQGISLWEPYPSTDFAPPLSCV